MDADLVVLDEELRVVATVCRGEVAYRGRGLGGAQENTDTI